MQSFMISRRSFIQTGTIVAGGILINPLPSYAIETGPLISSDGRGQWYQKPVRIMHTVLREIDARDYDAQKVVDYLVKGAYNTLCVNAGGIVDFFQNPLPAGNVNSFMGEKDLLKEISDLCYEQGIRVIARVDFRGVEEHVYAKFPDWFMKDEQGNPVRLTYTKPQLYASCYLGGHRNSYANEFISYILENYRIDGIWHNSPGFNGICYCENCLKSYQQFANRSLPQRSKSNPDEIETYMSWKRLEADRYMDQIKRTVKSFGDDKLYTAEIFSIYDVGQQLDWGLSFDNAKKHFDILVSVAFLTGHGSDKYYFDLNYGTTIIKFLKSLQPEKEAVVMYGGNGTSHRLVADPSVDLKIWLWQMLSVGGRFWNCYFTNVPTLTYDNRNAFNETDAYLFVRDYEKLLEQHVPFCNVGIYYSNATREFYRNKQEDQNQFGSEIRGVETVLMESHIPHDFIIDDYLNLDHLSKYRLIILPNVKCISEKEVDILEQYVDRGGNLIATYTTSLYSESGQELSDFRLGRLMGVSYAGKRQNTKTDNYQYILEKNHPLVAEDSGSTELLFNSGFTVLTKPDVKAKVICTWVPTIQNQPPDKAWVDSFSTEYPTLVEHSFGKGKVIYFANQPDLLSHEIGHSDPRNLLARAYKYLLQKDILIETNAPPSVNLGLTNSRNNNGQFILSLVNTTSGPQRPIRQVLPVHRISINFNIPGRSLKSFKVLKSQGDCQIEQDEHQIKIHLSKLEDYFSVFIDA
jgi:hypothetical protein